MRKTYRSGVDEAVKCGRLCRYYAENAQRFLADEVIQTTASKSYVKYQPLGVILVVMAWNYPRIGWCSCSLLRARWRKMSACSSTHRTSRSRR
jgi:acyl-CoA reductase-like NAD-dependent aldehyde dehydrogenase